MAYPSNPFTPYSPVPPAYFVGREREVQQILDHLASAAPGSSAISGERCIGRTSLLHYLTERLNETPLQGQFFPLYVDCQSIPRFTPTQFWQRVLRLLESKITDDALGKTIAKLLKQEEISCADFEVVSDQIHSDGQALVLLLDEFEWVVQTDPASGEITHDFLSGLRALINRLPKGLALVIGAVHPLDKLCEGIEFRGSPFSNSFLLVRLRPFTEAEVNQFFTKTLKDSNLEFTEDERNYVKQVAGDHPLLLQTASSLLFESKVRAGPIENYWPITKRFEEQSSHYFKSLWEASTEREKTALIAIATRDLEHELTQARLTRELRSLTERGLVVHRDGHPETFSFLFAQWIIENGERPIGMADLETESRLTALRATPSTEETPKRLHLWITDFEWDGDNESKIFGRHRVTRDEVEEIFYNDPLVRKAARGQYLAYGQTDSGRHLFVVSIRKRGGIIRVITARDMDDPEQSAYRERKYG